MNIDAQVALLRDARKELGEARMRVAHLEQLIDGLTGLLRAAGVELASSTNGTGLPGIVSTAGDRASMIRPRESALYVLQHREGLPMTARRVYEQVLKLGLANPEVKSGVSAYDMALRRLADEPGSGVSRDEDTGSYLYRSSDAGSRRQYGTASGRTLSDAEISELETRRASTMARGERFVNERTSRVTAAEARDPEVRAAPRKRTQKERAEFESRHNIETQPSRFAREQGDPA